MRSDGSPRLAWGMWKRFLIGGVAIALLTASAVATAALLQVKDVAQILSAEKPIKGINQAIDRAEAGQPQTILVLGTDRRFADIKAKAPARSDTLLLIRLNPDRAATTVMSIPRDLKVNIPGHGTDKINAAYAIGGPVLTVKTVKTLLEIPINHVVNINFGGFRRAVNYLGCVYVDVDRRYFNDNSGLGPDYAAIDIKPGYQKLCGQDALDYVRYRHEDNDLIRAARQQDFLRAAKERAAVRGLISLGGIKKLARLLKDYTQTDIRSSDAILRLVKLGILSAGHPLQEVHFPALLGGPTDTFVNVDLRALQKAKYDFLHAKASTGARGSVPSTAAERKAARKRKPKGAVTAGLVAFKQTGEREAASAQAHLPFPVYYPTLSTPYAQPADLDLAPRTYDIYDEHHRRFKAYRMVIKKGIVGEYYGIQGTTWMNPPILDRSYEKRRLGPRTFRLYWDGNRLRLIAWKTRRAAYWISNTLALTIPNKQMYALARSMRRLGG